MDNIVSYDDCIIASINDSIKATLKRLPELDAGERYSIIMEICEWITTPVDMDDVLIAPRYDD